MALGKRGVFGTLMPVAALCLVAFVAFGISSSQISPSQNATQVAQLPYFDSTAAPTPSKAPASQPDTIGTLTVPSAQVLALPITRGVDKATLNTGMAGAYSWSGPGQSGVFALAAHRIGSGAPFKYLDQVHVGDRLSVTSKNKTFTYRVISNVIVEPTDTSVLNGPRDESRIVLITCTPISTFAKRIVVTAVLIPN